MVLLPLGFYLAALNPFFLPGVYDNLVYFFGAASLVEQGSIQFRGLPIVDWPPMVSVLLAIPFLFGLESVVAAKGIIILCAAVGLLLALRLFRLERRPAPVLTLVLFAMLPTSFLMGTRIMSEWPYFMASLLFLLALHFLRDPGRACFQGRKWNFWGLAVGTGFLLGIASLTKFTGVLLGLAIIAQAVWKLRQHPGTFLGKGSNWRAILPEGIVATIGATCFLAWMARIQWQTITGVAPRSEYYHYGFVPEHFGGFDFSGLLQGITDLFFHTEAFLGRLGLVGWPTTILCGAFGMLVLYGLWIRLRSKESSPADWYVIGNLLLFGGLSTNQQTRYLMPIAPFLIGYFLLACGQMPSVYRTLIPSRLHRAVSAFYPQWGKQLPRAALALWFFVMTGAALHLLLLGNLSGTHRALFYPLNRTPETFYTGPWLDFYQASQYVREHSDPGNIAAIGEGDKYITYYTGRKWVDFETSGDFTFLMTLNGSAIPPDIISIMRIQPIKRFNSVALYRNIGHDQEWDLLRRIPVEEFDLPWDKDSLSAYTEIKEDEE